MAARAEPSSGVKPDKLMKDALMLDLHRAAKAANGQKTKKLYLVAEAVVDAAIAGDMTAAKEIFDRVDGRVPQEQRIAGADGGALLVEVEDARPSIASAVLGLMLERVATSVDTASPRTIEHTPDASGAKPKDGEIT